MAQELKNLTVATLPQDALPFVFSKSSQFTIADRIATYINDSKVTISGSSSAPADKSAITATTSRDFIIGLIDILKTSKYMGQYGLEFLDTLQSMTSGTNETVSLTRSFWTQLAKSISEATLKETSLNLSAALVYCSSVTGNNGIMTIASPDLFNLTSFLDSQEYEWFDEEFKTLYPDFEIKDNDLENAVNDVLTENPAMVGLPSSNPSTDEVDFNFNYNADVVRVADPETLGDELDDILEDLEQLFNYPSLKIPLESRPELAGNQQSVTITEVKTLNVVELAEGVTLSTLVVTDTPLSDYVVSTPTTIEVTSVVDTSLVDFQKSMVDQDWFVTAPVTDVESQQAKLRDGLVALGWKRNRTYVFDVVKLAKMLKFQKSSLVFTGVKTNKKYDERAVRALSDGLRGVWIKVRSFKFPNFSKLTAATSVLAAGLSTLGTVTGSSSLNQASNFINAFNNGLSALGGILPSVRIDVPSSVTPTTAMLNSLMRVMPNVIRAGKIYYEQQSATLTSLRGSINQDIISVNKAFNSSLTPLPSREAFTKAIKM